MQEPVVEPPQVQSRLQPGGYGPVRSARRVAMRPGDSGAGEPGRRGGHGEGLRRTRGEAAGEKLGASPIERSAVNVGSIPQSSVSPARQAGSGQARGQLMAAGCGGVLVVVGGRESRSQGEGGQRVRGNVTGRSGDRR